MTDLRYPVGKYERRDTLTPDERTSMIAEIAETPARMRKAIAGLTDSQLETPYREGGWTVRQVVHHVPDSHLNSYTRFKLALTEEHPTIRPYDEAKWAELSDSRDTPIETSLTLLESLHDRWTRLLRAMSADDYRRTLNHPDSGVMSLDTMLTLYAWHGRHHVAHITSLRERMGW
ncbi:MAG: YfiT family bacillithiol transferase [Acidobacteriota bacterium]